ncbi:MAG TPA: inorganic diphosphatase [Acidimicrobiia bacterium]|jgi:inorganic pyrophosphatase
MDEVVAVIEIPRGSRNKYEADHETGAIWLDRMLFTSVQYPTDYGYVPETLAADGDPIDVMVLLDEPTFPGCRIRSRVIGVLHMEDEKGQDDKLLAVVATDPRVARIRSIDDVEEAVLDEIAHFFEVYKALEPGKASAVGHWADATRARELLLEAQEAYSGSKG